MQIIFNLQKQVPKHITIEEKVPKTKNPQLSLRVIFLGFTSRSKIQWNRRLLFGVDLTMAVFIATDIIGQSTLKPFGMLWGQDNSRLNLCLGCSRHNGNKIDHEL